MLLLARVDLDCDGAHGMTCTRRNHIYCWVMKSDYKKLGRKKPGLWTEDFFVIFFFVGWPGLEDDCGHPRRSFILSTPLLSFIL